MITKKVGDYNISIDARRITITGELTKQYEEHAKEYKKKYGYPLYSPSNPIYLSASVTPLAGCCSGKFVSLLRIPKTTTKTTTIKKQTELLKLMMAQFSRYAILVYICRSDNKILPKIFTKAGWKKSRGPTGKYYPHDYTLDVYTVDPRLPKIKLPSLSRKKVESKQKPVVMLTERQKYFGWSIDNIKRRIGELRG